MPLKRSVGVLAIGTIGRVRAGRRLLAQLTRRGLLPIGGFSYVAYSGRFDYDVHGRDVAYDCQAGDPLGRMLYWTDGRGWEPAMIETVASLAPLVQHFADVGSFSGVYCTIAGAHNPALTATAVEPNPDSVARLRANLVANGLQERVDVVVAAVGDAPGRATLTVGADPTAAALNSGDGSANGVEVDVRTIDEIIGTSQVGLIKLDVEGFELAALRGATATLTREQPWLLIECLNAAQWQDVCDWLRPFGYAHVAWMANEVVENVDAFPVNNHGHFNFLFETADRRATRLGQRR